jgi:hypothetical protein
LLANIYNNNKQEARSKQKQGGIGVSGIGGMVVSDPILTSGRRKKA